MDVGMLWFDASEKRSLKEKIEQALQVFETRYGKRATICYVYPGMLIGASLDNPEVDVRGSNMILPNHFWVNSEDTFGARAA